MKRLDLTVFETGDILATLAEDGSIKVYAVLANGNVVPQRRGLLMRDGDTPIEDLDFSVRTYNLLKREGVETLAGLAEWWQQQVATGQITPGEGASEIRNFGTNNVREVASTLAAARGEVEIITITAHNTKGTEG